MTIEKDVLLAPLTTFHIGGPARFFARVKNIQELRESLDFARKKKLAVFVLGGGSNILFDDAGFEGLVIKIKLAGVEIKKNEGDTMLVVAGAGEPWDRVVERAVGEGLWGIENLSGIPGTTGAAPVQNIGAYGSELKDALLWVETFDTRTGEPVRFQNHECDFGYRTSRFKQEPGRFVILRVALTLTKKGSPNISYRDLAEAFAGKPAPTPTAVRVATLAIRARKFPNLAREGTAGSFFLNPVVSSETAARLLAAYPGLPQFPEENGVKISLAWLLDHALHLKGLRAGSVRLFENQPLCIVAARGASARDVRALAQEVMQYSKKELGIDVEPEVKMV